MKIHNFNYNNKEYTLVDTYKVDNGKVIQLNSDDDIILFLFNKEGKIKEFSQQEEKTFREKHGLIDPGYVTANFKDLLNGELHAKKVDSSKERKFKDFFKSKLAEINIDLTDSKYINKRLDIIKYREKSRINAYALDTVYLRGGFPNIVNNWILMHETVHALVNMSKITSLGIIEGITDNIVRKMLPNGNYSQNYHLYGGNIQVNNSGSGQNHLVTFAKQLEYALGSEYNIYEMLISPHNQIKKYSQIYNQSKCRVLLHKINKLYHDATIENFKIAQEYMLEMIFDKKIESVVDTKTAIEYFNELTNFGLLRGRINGKDEDLAKYYYKQLDFLNKKGIDISNIPAYKEKTFYPCGDCYFRYNSYLKSSIKAKKEGKIEYFQILYNKDNTCVYIIVDGQLQLIQNDSFDNKRLFNNHMINQTNTRIVQLDNGNYLITGPDGIVEEVRDTNSDIIVRNKLI